MAQFNPTVPDTQDPNWLGWSKPISDIPADKTMGIALSGAGDLLKVGVEAGDQWVKRDIENKAYAQIDPLRDAMSADLEAKLTNAQRSPGDPLSLTATNTEQNVPAGIQNGIDRIQKLSQARAETAIPTNTTLYSGQTLAVAKQLRTEYPGWREYIDQKVSEASGMPVANAYFKDQIQDLNHLQTQTNSQRNKAEAMLKEGMSYPGAKEMNAKFQNNQVTPSDIFNWSADVQAKDRSDAQRRLAAADRKGAVAEDQSVAVADYGLTIGDRLDTQLKVLTLNTPWGTTEKVGDLMRKIQTGEVKIDPEAAVRMGPAIQGLRNTLYADFMDVAQKRDPNAGNMSYSARAGGLESLKTEANNKLQVFDDFFKYVAGEKFPLADLAKKRAEAMTSQAREKMYDDVGFKKGYLAMKVAAEDMGNNMAALFATEASKNNLDDTMKTYFSGEAFKALTGNKGQANPTPTTMTETSDKVKTMGLGINEDGTPNKDNVEFNKSLMQIPQIIGNPDMPLANKLNVANWAFQSKNLPFLRRFNMDYVDPTTGNWVEGKYGSFNRLTSQSIADGMSELRTKGGPEGQQAYNNWKQWSQLSLQEVIGQDLTSLSQYSKNLPVVNGQKVVVNWDTGDGSRPPHIILKNEKGQDLPTRTMNPVDQGYLTNIHDTVNRINLGMEGAARVAATDGSNPSAYILRAIINAGYTPGPTTTGLPKAITDAIRASGAMEAKSMDDRQRAIQKRAEEDSTGIRGAMKTLREMPPIPDDSGGQTKSPMDQSYSPAEINKYGKR